LGVLSKLLERLDTLYEGDSLGLSTTKIIPGDTSKHRKHADLAKALVELAEGKKPICIVESYSDIIAVFAGNDVGAKNAERFVEESAIMNDCSCAVRTVLDSLRKATEMAKDVLEELQESEDGLPKKEVEDMLSFLVRRLEEIL
jgi:hypothetical protein